MNSNQIAISSLAMDLKRVALSYHRGSAHSAQRFAREALKRKDEIKIDEIKPYLKEILRKLPEVLSQNDKQKLAEDALMFSIRFQNYAIHFE